MQTITFAQALKQARAKIYRHPNAWRVAILCGSDPQLKYAFDELRLTLSASSLPLKKVSFTERTIETERGGKFYVRNAVTNPEWLAGSMYTHLIWLFDPDISPGLDKKMQALMRSPVLDYELLLEHHCTL